MNNSNFKFVAILCGICFLLFGVVNADQFDEINSIINSGHTAGKQSLGVGMTWFFALILPAICILGATLLAYTYAKQKAEQDKNNNKIVIAVIIAVLVGAFVDAMATMLISQAMTGDSMILFNHIWKFFTSSLETVQ